MSLRVIEGGRADGSTAGLLILRASAVVTMSGGIRRAAGQAETGTLEEDRKSVV